MAPLTHWVLAHKRTVIRALFVPAVASLLGRWNWWLPQMPAKLLRVEPSSSPRPGRRRTAAEGAL